VAAQSDTSNFPR